MRVLCRPSARRPTRPRLHLLSPQLAYLLPTGNPSRRKCHRGAPNAFPIFATLSLPNPAYWNKSVFLYLQMTTGVSRFRYIFFLVYSIPYISVRLGRERQKKKNRASLLPACTFLREGAPGRRRRLFGDETLFLSISAFPCPSFFVSCHEQRREQ